LSPLPRVGLTMSVVLSHGGRRKAMAALSCWFRGNFGTNEMQELSSMSTPCQPSSSIVSSRKLGLGFLLVLSICVLLLRESKPFDPRCSCNTKLKLGSLASSLLMK
jgi:hypothetical protein